MTSRNREILALYDLIKDDIDDLRNKAPTEIDFSSHYESLQDLSRSIVNDGKTAINSKQCRYILLAYAIEIAKHPSTSFWFEFYSQLEIEQSNNQTSIHDALCKLLDNIGIDVETNIDDHRLLVGTLKLLLPISNEILRASIDFFIHYYKYYYKKGKKGGTIESAFKSWAFYEDYKDYKEQLIIVSKRLAKVIDYTIQHIDNIENEDVLIENIENDLKINIRQLLNLRISTLLSEILNIFSPAQFKAILRKQRDERAITPDGRNVICGSLDEQLLDYGTYIINNDEYEVTPSTNISIRDMEKWEYNEILFSNGLSYYRKKENFKVKIGYNEQAVRRFVNGDNISFIWCGLLPVSEKYIIDGIEGWTKGFSWDPKLKMMWGNYDEPPFLQIEIPKVVYFNPDNSNKKLRIIIGNNASEYRLDKFGFVSYKNITDNLNREIVQKYLKDVILKVILDDELIDVQKIILEDHMLFSNSSRELIKSRDSESKTNKRSFGEDRYCIFTTANEDDINISQQDVNTIEYRGTVGRYNIFDIHWITSDDFKINVRDFHWYFERKYFLEWWFTKNNTFSSIKELDIRGFTNARNAMYEDLSYRILDIDYNPLFNRTDNGIIIDENMFTLSGNIIYKDILNTELSPGEYIIEIFLGDAVSTKKGFHIIPKIDAINWPSILIENQTSILTVSAKNAVFIDDRHETTDTLKYNIYGKCEDKIKVPFAVESAPLSIKVNFVNPHITMEYTPERQPPIFSYRLYLKNKRGYDLLKEADFYSLNDIVLYVSGVPGYYVVLKVGDFWYKQQDINNDGYCKFEDMSDLRRFCDGKETIVSINLRQELEKDEGISKEFNIIWHPRIYSLKPDEMWFGGDINVDVNTQGPKDSLITLQLRTPTKMLAEQNIICTGKKECNMLKFKIDEHIIKDNAFLYLESFYFVNNKRYKLNSSVIDNGLIAPIEIRSNTKNAIPISQFIDNLLQFSLEFLEKKSPVNLSIPCDSIKLLQQMIIEIITYLDSNCDVLLPCGEYSFEYDFVTKITGRRDSLKIFKNSDGLPMIMLEDIFYKPDIDHTIIRGIGVSSLSDLECLYKQNITPIIIVNGQELNNIEKNTIINNSPNRAVLFIQRSIISN